MTESTKPVATVERDESRDVWAIIDTGEFYSLDEDCVLIMEKRQFVDSIFLSNKRNKITERHTHYVPFADLQTETARRVVAERQLTAQTETMLKLRAFVERIAGSAYTDDLCYKARDLLLEI
jgi:hypothetical protein